MSYSLDQYVYGQKLRFYNDEGRELVGGSNVLTADGHRRWDNGGATLGLFTLNANVDVVDPVIVCTLANGVKIGYTYDHNTFASDGDKYSISLRFYLLGKDGQTMKWYEVNNIEFAHQYNPEVGATKFYYTPPNFQYQLEYGDHPITFTSGGSIFTTYSFKPLVLTPPSIAGDVYVEKVQPPWGRSEIYFGYNTLDDFMNAIIENGDGTPITPLLPEDDTSTPGGGTQADPDYNPHSEPVDFPGLPSGGGAIASGFIRVYNPTSGQLQALANKLWSNDFFDTIEKIMNDPMEAMISLHSVPFQIVGGSNANIRVGNYNTEVSAKTVTTQYYTLDCGNISLPEHWASALDYSPYTTVDIFIPFVGVRPLQIDDVMNRVLNLKYNIDVLTGCAVAMLKCGDSVLYTYNTQVHAEIPYTMSSYGRLVQSIIGVAGTAIGGAAGGAGAIIGGAMGGALGTAMTKHSDISRGGSLGGAVGVMGDFTPYLIIHRPIQSLASEFASKKGYPSNITATLSSVSGYTVVDKIHLTGIDCTDTERDEIHALLKDGVII